VRPRVEVLEDRQAPAVLTVNTTADNTTDTSVLTFRDAITLVDNGGNPASLGQASMPTGWASQIDSTNPFGTNDTINFNITATSDSGGGYNSTTGVATIKPLSALPQITNAVIINGTTQGTYSGSPLIALNGSLAGPGAAGLSISAGSSTVEGLAINQFSGDGIDLTTNGGNLVQKDYIGTDATGSQALGNNYGISVMSSNNTIGGTTAGTGNVISGNTFDGVDLTGSANVLQGNIIGLNALGATILGNGGWGVAVYGTSNLIGGTDTNTPGTPLTGAGNVISGQVNTNFGGGLGAGVLGSSGVFLHGSGNNVQGNYIGTDKTGEVGLGNDAYGIWAYGGGNTIGGTTPGSGNVISGNGFLVGAIGAGIRADSPNLIQGNYIGTDAKGVSPLGNVVGIWEGGVVTIGGSVPGAGNLISANNTGIRGFGDGSQIQGNLIGTDYTGTHALGNGIGINFQDTGNNILIGGPTMHVASGWVTGDAGNVISGNYTGIWFSDAAYYPPHSGNVIEGNLIGTDITGTKPIGNHGGPGIFLGVNTTYTTIGGSNPGDRNIISGNATGIAMNPSGASAGPSNTLVEGNYIGTDVSGSYALGNGNGVSIAGANNNDIVGNVISGNSQDGVNISTYWNNVSTISSTGNIVQGNLIGTDATGTHTIDPNGHSLGNPIGVDVGASNNLIGGTTPGAGNLISGNSGDGVFVHGANSVSILANSIHDNGGLGIDFLANFANDNQTAPVLTSAITSGPGTTISGTLTSNPGTTFRIEFFASAHSGHLGADGQYYGDGQTYLGYVLASGNSSFTATGLSALLPGQNYLTATATVATANNSGYTYADTSAFSADYLVTAHNPTAVIRVNGPSLVVEGATLTFDASQSINPDGGPLVYFWTRDDGRVFVGPTMQQNYPDAGTYTETLTVINFGHASTTSVTVTVAEGTPVVTIGGPLTATVGAPLFFISGLFALANPGEDSPDSWNWTVSGGPYTVQPTGYPQYFQFIPQYSGRYTVSVTFTDEEGNEATASQSIDVAPAANISQTSSALPPGQLDPTFGTNGIQLKSLGSVDDEATNVFVQPDGKLLVAGLTQNLPNGGYSVTISRYLANGSIDTSYGTGGTPGTVTTLLTSPTYFFPLPTNQFVCEPDGSMVILWQTKDASGNVLSTQVTRYRSDAGPTHQTPRQLLPRA
jgi:hypothetical protein